MKSKIAEKIYNETTYAVKEEVRNYANLIVENERLKTELAEVKRLLLEMNSPTQRYSDRVVPAFWRMRMERFIK